MIQESTLMKSLSEFAPDGQDLLQLDEAGWSLQITANRNEMLACQLWEISVRRTPPADLKILDWAKQIVAGTTSLLETLRVLEVDENSQQAILRSAAPTEKEGKLCYYEVVLQGTGEATLRRYRAARNGQSRREQISYILTHESLAKLVSGMTAEAT